MPGVDKPVGGPGGIPIPPPRPEVTKGTTGAGSPEKAMSPGEIKKSTLNPTHGVSGKKIQGTPDTAKQKATLATNAKTFTKQIAQAVGQRTLRKAGDTAKKLSVEEFASAVGEGVNSLDDNAAVDFALGVVKLRGPDFARDLIAKTLQDPETKTKVEDAIDAAANNPAIIENLRPM